MDGEATPFSGVEVSANLGELEAAGCIGVDGRGLSRSRGPD